MTARHPPIIVAEVMLAARATTRPNVSASEALRTMRYLGVQSLVVEPFRPGEACGIVSLHDLLACLQADGSAREMTYVRDVMAIPPIVVAPGMRLEDCAALLLASQQRQAVVMQAGKPVGIVCDSDIFQAIESRRW